MSIQDIDKFSLPIMDYLESNINSLKKERESLKHSECLEVSEQTHCCSNDSKLRHLVLKQLK